MMIYTSISISKIVSLLKVETRSAGRGVGNSDLSDDNVEGEKSIERQTRRRQDLQ